MKKLFFALAIVLFPVPVWAGGCGCGSINAMISAAKSETIQAVNAYTAAEAQAIRSEILLAAQNIIGTIKSETATVVRALVALKESNVAAIKGQAVAGEAMKTEDLYGTAAQPSGLCGATSLGAGIQLGAQAGQEIHATMREKQFAYANTPGTKPVEFLHRILADDQPSEPESLDALFPLQSTLTEDQVAQAHESIKTLANPRPLPMVTDAQKETPDLRGGKEGSRRTSGRRYRSAQPPRRAARSHIAGRRDRMGAESVVGSGRKRHSSRHCGRKTFGSRALQTALTDARGQPQLVCPDSHGHGCRTVAGNGVHAGISDGACPEKHGAYGPPDRHCGA